MRFEQNRKHKPFSARYCASNDVYFETFWTVSFSTPKTDHQPICLKMTKNAHHSTRNNELRKFCVYGFAQIACLVRQIGEKLFIRNGQTHFWRILHSGQDLACQVIRISCNFQDRIINVSTYSGRNLNSFGASGMELQPLTFSQIFL